MPQSNETFRPKEKNDSPPFASRDALIDAARQLAPLIRENVAPGEHERRLPAAVANALSSAGFFRLCRPHESGWTRS